MKKLLDTFLLLFVCFVCTKSLAQTTTIGGINVTGGNLSPAVTYAAPATSTPVANFSLSQATSNANLTGVTFTTSGTYSSSTDITAFTLYVNTIVNAFTSSTAVPTATVTATAAGLQTISLSTPYTMTAGLTYFFFIVPTVGASAVTGNTIAISSIASSNITVSAGSVSGSVPATGIITILNPSIISTTPASECGSGALTLNATPSSGAAVSWYSTSSTAAPSIATGNSFTTPSISAPTTYYAAASQNVTIQTGTLTDNTTNLAGPYNFAQRTDLHYFSSVNACTINSVDIYPNTTGTVIITLCDGSGYGIINGTPIATSPTYTITAAQVSNTVPVTIPLGFSVPAGAVNYTLGGSLSATAMIYRGAANSTYGPYPTTVAGFAETGDAGGNSTATGVSGAYTGYGARCYFYNWNVTINAPQPTGTAVVATATPFPTGVTATATPATACLGGNLTLTGTATGAATYSWTGPGGTAIASPSSLSTSVTGLVPANTGVYTLTATAGTTCSVTATSAAVSVNALPTPTFTVTPVASICSGTSVTYSTQAGQSSYNWSVPGISGVDYNITSGGTGSGSNTVTLTWISAGAQTVSVNYANASGCNGTSPATNTTTVNALPVPTFSSSAGSNTCAGTSVTYTTQPGQIGYTWTIPGTSGTDYNITAGSTSSNSITLTWSTPGSKTITANYTDGNGCMGASPASNTTTVNARPVPTFTSSPSATCAGTSVTYTTQASQSAYIWSVPGTSGVDYTISSGGTGGANSTVTLTWASAGIKAVTVNYTNSNGCTGASAASSTTTVNARPIPTFTSFANSTTCASSSVTYATQSGQSAYVWNVPGTSGVDYSITSGGTDAGSSTVTLTWLTPGSKTVTVNYTNSNGCTGASAASNTTTVNSLPVPTFISSPTPGTCANSSVTYTAAPGQSSYIWTLPGTSGVDYNITSGGTSGTDNTVTLSWVTPGSTTVTVNYTDANGCMGASAASSTTLVNAQPVPTFISSPGGTACAGDIVTYTTQGGQSSYNWTVPGAAGTDYTVIAGGTGSGSNSVTLYWSTAGSQTVTVNYVDLNTCTGASPASNTVLVNPLPAVISGTNHVCLGLSTTLTDASSGGDWSSSDPSVATVDGFGLVTGVSANPATITYTLPTGCLITQPFTVNPLPLAIFGTTNVCAGSTTTLVDAGGGTWTSDNLSAATIGLISGVASGVAEGTANITYTLPTGCITSVLLNVNPLPAPISGTPVVCAGQTTPLSDGSFGGRWNSSNLSKATVDVGSGVVTGVANGTPTITYTLTTGCFITTPVTVNALPGGITGTASVCVGLTTVLHDASTTGTWSSSDGTLATIGSSSGVVTAIASGSPVITYTLPVTGCYRTAVVTVNSLPGAIGAATNVCAGSSTPLSDAGGGTWTSSNTSVASIGTSSGVLTGVTSGTSTINYYLSTGCVTSTHITVNPSPAVITGSAGVCQGATAVLHDGSFGGTWTSASGTGVAIIDASSGSVTGVVPGSVTITYTLPTGCKTSKSVTVNQLPAAITGSTYLCAGATSHLADGTPGGSWTSSGTAMATVDPAAGIVTGVSAGNPVISYTLSTGCFATVTSTINPLPTVYTVTGGGSYCSGGGGLHVGLNNSSTGITYQLFYGVTLVGSPITGTGFPLDFGLQTLAEAYTVVASNGFTGCSTSMAGSAPVITNSLPAIYTVTGGGHYCSSGSGVHIGLDASAAGINYQLAIGGVPVGSSVSGSSGPVDFGLITTPGTYTVVATNATTSCTSNMLDSATVIVDPTVAPAVTLSTPSGSTVCSGNLLTITAMPVNGGATPVYSWAVNGVAASGTSGSFSYVPTDGDVISTVLTSSAACAAPATVSSSISVTVLPTGSPEIHISATPGNIVCQGTAVTFTSASSFGGPTPEYVWTVNSTVVGSSSSYSYVPANHDNVACILISNYRCRATDSGASNNIIMEADPSVAPTVSVTAYPGYVIDRGQTATVSATVTNGGSSPAYQWYINGNPVTGATSRTYTASNFANGDSVACNVIGNGVCSGLSGKGSIIMRVLDGVKQVVATGDNISLLPNPNKGAFTVKGTLGSADDQEVTIAVTDMVGQVVYTQTILARAGNIDQQVTLNSSLANGMYLLSLHSGSGNNVFHMVIER